jgi:vitamin B12 transporter
MKRKIFMVIAGFIISSTVTAQDTSYATPLDEVVVTATKFPKKQSETGKVLTIITKAQLERSAGKDLSQLLNEQAGLVINGSNSNPGKDKAVYLRGAKSEYTLILLDGIPVVDPSGVGGAFDLRLLSIDQIERIEILKGSQSTLYGSDAIAGVINIITKKQGAKKAGGAATLSYGSYQTFKGNAAVHGNTEKANYHIGYTHFNTKGISEAADKTGNGNFDKDGYKENSLNATVGIKATNKLNITPFLRLADYKGKYDDDAFTDGNGKYTSRFLNTGLNAQYKLAAGTIHLSYGYTNTRRKFDGAFGVFDFKGLFHNAEIFMAHDITRYIKLLGGINVQQAKMLDTSAVKKNPSITLTSPYLSVYLHNPKGFHIELGGRYNNHSKYGNNFTYNINPSWLIAKKVKLFVNYSTGFKAPTLYNLYGKFGSNENLKPEKSNSWEGGVQASVAKNKVDIRIVGFDRKIKDVIASGPQFSLINQDKQHDKGFEIEPSFFINKNITIKAGYAFVDGTITTRTGAKDTTYFNLIRRPKHSVTVNFSYQITQQLFVSSNLKTFSRRTDLFFDPVTFEASGVNLKSYALWDLYAEYKFLNSKWKLFADAKNITHSNYSEVYGYNTMGFNITAGINVHL